MPDSPTQFRIVHAISTGNFGGAQHSIHELIQRLDPTQFQSLFLCGIEGEFSQTMLRDVDRIEGASFDESWLRLSRSASWKRSLWRAGPRLFGDVIRASAALKAANVDVVCTNDVKSHVVFGLAARLAGVPVLWHLREICGDLSSVLRKASRIIPSTIVANSHASLESLGRHVRNGAVVYNGIDVDQFHITGEKRAAARQAFGIPDNAIVVGCLGHLSPVKGHLVLVEAMKTIAQQSANVVLLLGGGEAYLTRGEHCGMTERIRDLAGQLGISNHVRLVGHQDDVPHFMAAVDIFAQPSLQEGFGRSCAEAMACLLPTVASRVGGLPEVVDDGETGLLVTAGSPDELAAALCKLSADRELRARFGTAGRARVENLFSLKAYVDGMTRQLLQTVSRRRSREAQTDVSSSSSDATIPSDLVTPNSK